jgi:hypothetical protein
MLSIHNSVNAEVRLPRIPGLRRLRRVQVHRLRVSSVPPYGPDNRRERPGLPDAALH